jgi:REP element-mobilizing transposase RayT
MPRGPRIDAPGAVQHVMLRGIERRLIFADDEDREDLAARLSRILPESDSTCFAWAFMPNHVHLILRTGATSVSRVMARVATGHARRFNERHDRVGHLFQNRFRSRLVLDDPDLLGVIRYVHLNPVAAGIVPDLASLATHRWTGHAGICGQLAPRTFHAAAATLALFGRNRRDARRALRSFMEIGLHEPSVDPLESGGGSHESWVDGDAGDRPELGDSVLDRIARPVCRHFQIDPKALRGIARVQPVSRARAVLAHVAVTRMGVSLVESAWWLGISEGALSRAVGRGAKIAREEGIASSLGALVEECPQGKKGNNVPGQATRSPSARSSATIFGGRTGGSLPTA